MFSGRRLIVLGLVLVLLIAIPLTVYLASRQQEVRSQATPSTTLSMCQAGGDANSCISNISAAIGQPLNVDVVMNPGQNLVSFVKLTFTYDPTKLELSGQKITPNPAVATTLTDPVYTAGTNGAPSSATVSFGIVVNQSAGVDPTKIIQTPTKIATITFTPTAATNGTATLVDIDASKTQVLSTRCDPADPNNCPDPQGENVLSTKNPAQVQIAASGSVSGTPSPSPSGSVSITPIPSGVTPTATTTNNTAPVCSSLNIDRSPSGSAPFSITFTANGTDSNGTISKVSFNYGDGPTEEVTSGGGVGTNTISVQKSHTYTNAGTYTARVTLTDNNGATSDATTCTQTITVSAPTAAPTTIGNAGGTGGTTGGSAGGGVGNPGGPGNPGGSGGSGGGQAGGNPDQLPAAGPGDGLLIIGAAGVILSILGGIVFFLL